MAMPNLVTSRHINIWDETTSHSKSTMVRVPAAHNFTLRLQKFPYLEGINRGAQSIVYPAAVKLTDQLMERHILSLTNGARVIELGCGLAVPGMVSAALGAHVLLTDVPQVIPFIEKRAALNFRGHAAGFGGSVRSAALEWDRASAKQLLAREGYFDLVLSSDGIYAPLYGDESSERLADVICSLCGPSTTALIAVHHRPAEGAPSDGTEEFLVALRRRLEVTQLEVDHTGFQSDFVTVVEAKQRKTCQVRERSVSVAENDEHQSKKCRS
eukprot:TRINITY_DN106601_c0_g1_i1.p1 TRINITY_DN106601_c0_g1~~TRINITY_DN106601_c0_g1_i1.p1  ORF type:complete len:270 (+),score=35.93 TRINITY_DN106601_c0_g1_i1:107-916(+)